MSKNTIYILFFVLLPAYISFCQEYPGARQISMSHSDVALSNDAFAIFNNPAGLPQMDWREFAVYYSPAPFGMNELANGYGAYHEPTPFGSFGVGFMTYGYDLYRENKFALSYSRNFENKFFAGISVIYQTLHIQNYGNDGSLNFIIGGLAYLNRDFRIGFSAENLLRSTYGSEPDQIPVVFNAGVSFDALPEMTINAAVQKEIDFPVSLRFGFEYNVIQYLSLRFGFNNQPNSYSAGIGINYSLLQLDYAVFTHQDLGLTHQVGIIVHFSSDELRMTKVKRNLHLE
ncbi:MAG: hypothetical protein V1720_02060 [bacterium]